VAVSAVLAVVEPYSSGIGGGGFWLLHRARDGFETMVDGREKAPLASTKEMYLDNSGKPVKGLSINGASAAGIPGEPAALVHIARNYGRLPLVQSLAPAIRLARNGFVIDDYYLRIVKWRLMALQESPAAARIFLDQSEVPKPGYKVKQPQLAKTLEAIASDGKYGFYSGSVAANLVKDVQAAGGIWTLEDLKRYRVVEREPVRGSYRGMEIISAAPPSSGGIVLMTMLNILSRYDLTGMTKVERTHLIIESMRRAYRDRAKYLGDPDFVQMPVERLIHPFYADGLARDILPARATPSLPQSPLIEQEEGRDTTHFSIIDTEGNRVAATLSINYPFGSGFVSPSTGVLLNDEMDDFSASPGVPNVYGLIGGSANAIAPGKRMLSSMTPTFVETRDGVAILGTPGGSRIITMLLLGILELAEGKSPTEWVSRRRLHHQYLPDRIQYEPGALTEDEAAQLQQMGHELQPLKQSYGNMQGIYWNRKTGELKAASDPRGIGSAVVR
jgi:gamma-glutamyltranspeptidase/glutathione hydrolase